MIKKEDIVAINRQEAYDVLSNFAMPGMTGLFIVREGKADWVAIDNRKGNSVPFVEEFTTRRAACQWLRSARTKYELAQWPA